MKKIITTSSFIIFFYLVTVCQQSDITFTFVAKNYWNIVTLDSVLIENITKNVDTTLYYPNNSLQLNNIANIDVLNGVFPTQLHVRQNYPNPIKDKSKIQIYLPNRGRMTVVIHDVLGRILCSQNNFVNSGFHTFEFYPCSEQVYFLTAFTEIESQTIKMISNGKSQNTDCRLEYLFNNSFSAHYKNTQLDTKFEFNLGDELRLTGYTIYGDLTGNDTPQNNTEYLFHFEQSIPCPDVTTFIYYGQEYTTTLIGNQCWMAENLNVGTMIYGNELPSDNSTIEKYCYDNNTTSCDNFGGLYFWNEIMGYSTNEGVQGICPDGWHVPTDEEWKILEGYVDSYYSVGDSEWDGYEYRGFDAGLNLKSASNWDDENNGTDLFGFSGEPAGIRVDYTSNNFNYAGVLAAFWTSNISGDIYAWYRSFTDANPIIRHVASQEMGYSVRCLKD